MLYEDIRAVQYNVNKVDERLTYCLKNIDKKFNEVEQRITELDKCDYEEFEVVKDELISLRHDLCESESQSKKYTHHLDVQVQKEFTRMQEDIHELRSSLQRSLRAQQCMGLVLFTSLCGVLFKIIMDVKVNG